MKEELERLSVAIADFEPVDIGYPKDEHEILPQDKTAAEVAALLRSLNVPATSRANEFYALCNGIELPDIDNAYSVHSLADLLMVKDMASEPVRFGDRDFLFFGTDGGGGRFVVTLDTDEVYFLPVGEVTPERVYTGEDVEFRASTIDEWIDQLAERVEEYAQGD